MAVAAVEENAFEYLADVEFVEDVSAFQCARCNNKLIQHYISNCNHAFCTNCKRILDDGSQRWRCPTCEQYIQNIDVRNEEQENKLKEMMVHCPNYKYDCQFVDQLKLIRNHLKDCEFTKEKCLPKLLEDNENKNMNLEQMFEINQRFNDLKAEMKEMRERIIQLESKDKEDETTLDKKLEFIKSIVNGARSDMAAETNRIELELNKMKSVDLALEECKTKLSEFKGQSDSMYRLIDFKEEKMIKAIADAKIQVQEINLANSTKIREEIDKNINKRCEILTIEIESVANEIAAILVELAQQIPKIDELNSVREDEKLEIEDLRNDVNGTKNSIEDLKMDINTGLEEVRMLQIQLNENDLNAQTLNTPNEIFSERLNEAIIALNENIASTKESFELNASRVESINTAVAEIREELAKQITMTKCVNEKQILTETSLMGLQAQQKELEADLKTSISTLLLEHSKTEEKSNSKLEDLNRRIQENQEKFTKEMESFESITENIEQHLVQAQTFIRDLHIQQEKLDADLINNNEMLKNFHVKIETLANDLNNKETKDESANKQGNLMQLIEENKILQNCTTKTFKVEQIEAESLTTALQTKQQKLETYLANMWKGIIQMKNDFSSKHEDLSLQLERKETKDEAKKQIRNLTQQVEEIKNELHLIHKKHNTAQESQNFSSENEGQNIISMETANIAKKFMKPEYEWKNQEKKDFPRLQTEVAGPSRVVMNNSTTSSWDFEKLWPSKETPTYNVLLLGQIGIGKSTFVNAFCNYFKFKDVKRSKNQNLIFMDNCDFVSSDKNTEQLYVHLNKDPNECLKTEGQSSTKMCEAYELKIKDYNLRLIDTPGIGDGGGIERDNSCLEKTMEFISRYETLHAICIFMKSEETPLNSTAKYCIKQLLSQLHQNSKNNLAFVFTNNSLVYVREYLRKLKSVPEISFRDENIFYFETKNFKFLNDDQIPINFDHEKYQEFERLLSYIVEHHPFSIKESIGIDLTRRAIIQSSRSLSKINEILIEKKKTTPISTLCRELLNTDLEKYENLRRKLTNFTNILTMYLNENALVVVNNESEEHMKQLISNENALNKKGSDNQRVIKKLIDMLENYRSERSMLEKAIKDSKQNEQRGIEIEEVERVFLELTTMQTSGELMEFENLN